MRERGKSTRNAHQIRLIWICQKQKAYQKGAFRVKKLNHKILSKRKRKIEKRLERRNWEDQERPMFKGSNIHYKLDGRDKGIACGGIGGLQTMAKQLGRVEEV